jgi:hypothetical protein
MSRFVEPTEEEAQKFMGGQTSDGSARFQEPTEEEAQEFIAKKEPTPYQSTEQDFGAMDAAKLMGQGLTYENMDEILGALKATKKTAFGDQKMADWLETYKRERDLEREEFKRLHEQYPWSSFAAEGLGAVYSPINKVLGPAKAASGFIDAVKSGTMMGAKGGLLTGIGGSEQDLSKPVQYAKDIASYGATGGVLGGSLGGLTNIGSSAVKGIEDFGPFGKNLVTAFKKAKEGLGFTHATSEARISDLSQDTANKFADIMYADTGPLAKTSKEISAYFNEADAQGAKVLGIYDSGLRNSLASLVSDLEANKLLRPKEVMTEIAEKNPQVGNILKLLNRGNDVDDFAMSSNEVRIFVDNLDKLLNNELNTSQTYNFARWLQGDEVPGFAKLGNSKFKQLIPNDLIASLKQSAKVSADDVLGANSEELFNKFKDVRASTVETVLNKGKPFAVSNVWQSDFTKDQIKSKLYDEFQNIITNLSKPSVSGTPARDTIRYLKNRISEVNQKYPDLKINLDDFFKQLEDVSSQVGVRSKFLPNEGHADAGDLLARLTSVTGYGAANILGRAASIPVELNKLIVKADDKVLATLAQKLKQTPTLQHVGQALEDGIQNKSAKNAALFMMMQNPQARAVANEVLGVNQNEK